MSVCQHGSLRRSCEICYRDNIILNLARALRIEIRQKSAIWNCSEMSAMTNASFDALSWVFDPPLDTAHTRQSALTGADR